MMDGANQETQYGQYRLIQHIGSGSIANVYLAEHSADGTRAAVKVLQADLSDEEADAFLEQARRLAGLQHPRIVRVLAYGFAGTIPYLVMDYAPRGSLRQQYPRGSRLPLSTVVTYVQQIADALHYVHERQIIHRDIKPHNLLLSANLDILLSDFSIAVIAQSAGYHKQQTRDFEGTILYAAPEQIRGLPRIASDQYALGVVVYEWLSGSCPFVGTVEEIASQHALTPPPSLRERVPSLSPAVEEVVLRALAKNPYDRFVSVRDFASALERASRFDGPSASPLPAPIAHSHALPATTRALMTYRGHSSKVHALAWSPDGRSIASSGEDETIQVWEASSGQRILTYHTNALQPSALAWSPDGYYIASAGGLFAETVQVWEAATGQRASDYATYDKHSEQVQAIAWSPDGRYIASAGDDNTIHTWDALTGRTITIYRSHSSSVRALAWTREKLGTPDKFYIASGGDDKTAHVWKPESGRNVTVYYAHLDRVNAVAWSPGGTHLASASDDATVQIWDAFTGRRGLTYNQHNGAVTSVAWSPDGVRVASGGRGESVHIWHALTSRPLAIYRGHTDWVQCVAWSPGGTRLASASWDGTVQLWNCPQ
jgi:WD40 repeat protein